MKKNQTVKSLDFSALEWIRGGCKQRLPTPSVSPIASPTRSATLPNTSSPLKNPALQSPTEKIEKTGARLKSLPNAPVKPLPPYPQEGSTEERVLLSQLWEKDVELSRKDAEIVHLSNLIENLRSELQHSLTEQEGERLSEELRKQAVKIEQLTTEKEISHKTATDSIREARMTRNDLDAARKEISNLKVTVERLKTALEPMSEKDVSISLLEKDCNSWKTLYEEETVKRATLDSKMIQLAQEMQALEVKFAIKSRALELSKSKEADPVKIELLEKRNAGLEKDLKLTTTENESLRMKLMSNTSIDSEKEKIQTAYEFRIKSLEEAAMQCTDLLEKLTAENLVLKVEVGALRAEKEDWSRSVATTKVEVEKKTEDDSKALSSLRVEFNRQKEQTDAIRQELFSVKKENENHVDLIRKLRLEVANKGSAEAAADTIHSSIAVSSSKGTSAMGQEFWFRVLGAQSGITKLNFVITLTSGENTLFEIPFSPELQDVIKTCVLEFGNLKSVKISTNLSDATRSEAISLDTTIFSPTSNQIHRLFLFDGSVVLLIGLSSSLLYASTLSHFQSTSTLDVASSSSSSSMSLSSSSSLVVPPVRNLTASAGGSLRKVTAIGLDRVCGRLLLMHRFGGHLNIDGDGKSAQSQRTICLPVNTAVSVDVFNPSTLNVEGSGRKLDLMTFLKGDDCLSMVNWFSDESFHGVFIPYIAQKGMQTAHAHSSSRAFVSVSLVAVFSDSAVLQGEGTLSWGSQHQVTGSFGDPNASSNEIFISDRFVDLSQLQASCKTEAKGKSDLASVELKFTTAEKKVYSSEVSLWDADEIEKLSMVLFKSPTAVSASLIVKAPVLPIEENDLNSFVAVLRVNFCRLPRCLSGDEWFLNEASSSFLSTSQNLIDHTTAHFRANRNNAARMLTDSCLDDLIGGSVHLGVKSGGLDLFPNVKVGEIKLTSSGSKAGSSNALRSYSISEKGVLRMGVWNPFVLIEGKGIEQDGSVYLRIHDSKAKLNIASLDSGSREVAAEGEAFKLEVRNWSGGNVIGGIKFS